MSRNSVLNVTVNGVGTTFTGTNGNGTVSFTTYPNTETTWKRHGVRSIYYAIDGSRDRVRVAVKSWG
jgi:hypothetical protein